MAWPSWWSDAAESSPSANAELRFALSRRLGLDAEALLRSDQPQLMWKVATFKRSTVTSEVERQTIVSFGTSLARILLSATAGEAAVQLSAADLRKALLSSATAISLGDLLSLTWSLGIPVVQLRVFPVQAKRMCAMTSSVRGRCAILLAKDSSFPAQAAYYIAHELGHIALGHLAASESLLDFEDPLRATSDEDDEQELAADAFALELLTGEPSPMVVTKAARFSARGLANAAQSAATTLGIDAGTLALCFGHSTKRWDKTTAALKIIYGGQRPPGAEINNIAFTQLDQHALSEESIEYLRAVTSTPD